MLKLKDYGDTTFVTGLRAYAILGVLLVHLDGAGLRRLGGAGSLIADFGRTGVFCFLVISGFSVASSFLSAGSFWPYLMRRFFRLAPLYYIFLFLSLFTFSDGTYWSKYLGHQRDLRDLLLHLAFLHAFSTETASSFFNVEWSLSVEMFWYLWSPWLLRGVDKGFGLALVLAGVLWRYGFLSAFEAQARADPKVELWVLWNPAKYLLSYALGVWAFRLRGQVRQAQRSAGVLFTLGLIAAYGAVSVALGKFAFSPYYASTLLTFLLLVFGSSQEPVCRKLCMSRGALLIGTLSYGVYLNHLFVSEYLPVAGSGYFQGAELLRAAVVLAISLLLSWMTYQAIELPGQRWGRQVEAWYFGRNFNR